MGEVGSENLSLLPELVRWRSLALGGGVFFLLGSGGRLLVGLSSSCIPPFPPTLLFPLGEVARLPPCLAASLGSRLGDLVGEAERTGDSCLFLGVVVEELGASFFLSGAGSYSISSSFSSRTESP